jgi:polysaccharide biosynthesis/export protein
MNHRNVFPFRAALLALGVAALSVAFAGCTSTGKPMPRIAAEINATLESDDTVLAPGDVIELTFPEKKDWDQSVKVRPDGHASFAGIDDVLVAGQTVPRLGEVLRLAYARVFTTPPAIAVGVSTLASRNVYVMGDVHEPGQFPVEGRITLTDAIALAGGFIKPTAALQNVMLVRYSPRENRQHAWRIDARPSQWGKGDPILLQAYDTVLVPNTAIDDVDIWIDQHIRLLIPFPYLVTPSGTP